MTRSGIRRPLLALAILVCAAGGTAAGCASSRTMSTGAAPRSARAGSSLSAASVESRDPALAASLLNAAAVRTPENLVRAAVRYQQLGIRDRAFDFYSEAIAVDAKHAPAYDGRARIWRDWGRLDEALGDAARATYLGPDDAVAWNTTGTILQRLGRGREARSAFTRAAALDPDAAYSWNNLCYLSLLDARVEEAVLECSVALAVEPEFRAASHNLALAYATLGKLDRAFDLYVASAGVARAHFNLGLIRLAQKDYPAAISAFDAASRAEPTFAAARTHAREARRLLRLNEAATYARD